MTGLDLSVDEERSHSFELCLNVLFCRSHFMPMIGMYTDISALLDAIVAGNEDHIIATARPLLQQGAPAAVIAGRVGMIAAHGDQDGHAIIIIHTAASLSLWLHALPFTPDEDRPP